LTDFVSLFSSRKTKTAHKQIESQEGEFIHSLDSLSVYVLGAARDRSNVVCHCWVLFARVCRKLFIKGALLECVELIDGIKD